jgi:hypothetical protein
VVLLVEIKAGPKLKTWMVVVVTCIPISVLAVLVGSFAAYHGRKKRTQRGEFIKMAKC